MSKAKQLADLEETLSMLINNIQILSQNIDKLAVAVKGNTAAIMQGAQPRLSEAQRFHVKPRPRDPKH